MNTWSQSIYMNQIVNWNARSSPLNHWAWLIAPLSTTVSGRPTFHHALRRLSHDQLIIMTPFLIIKYFSFWMFYFSCLQFLTVYNMMFTIVLYIYLEPCPNFLLVVSIFESPICGRKHVNGGTIDFSPCFNVHCHSI